MSEIKLIYESDYVDYSDDGVKVEITTKAVSLDRILEVFTDFLHAIGYVSEGCLDFVDYEAHEKEVTDAYNRGYSDGVQEMTDENTHPGEPAYEMDKPRRYRVKSVGEMEKILGIRRGLLVDGDEWEWDPQMWNNCGKEVRPCTGVPYKYTSQDNWLYLPEWVEEIPE